MWAYKDTTLPSKHGLPVDSDPNQVHSATRVTACPLPHSSRPDCPPPTPPPSLPSTRQAGGRHLSLTPVSNTGSVVFTPGGGIGFGLWLPGGGALRAKLSAPPRQALPPPSGKEGWGEPALAPRDKSLAQGMTFNRSQRGSCSATHETLTQNQVVYE